MSLAQGPRMTRSFQSPAASATRKLTAGASSICLTDKERGPGQDQRPSPDAQSQSPRVCGERGRRGGRTSEGMTGG
jgi:hypothetical protein